MRNEDKERLNQQTQKKYFFHRLANGCKAVWENAVHKIILIFFYPAAILIWYLFKNNLGLESVNLSKIPHILLGGSTGSGKKHIA